MPQDVELIVACDLYSGIGENGGIPWRISEDMVRFRELTSGNVVIMGRSTWDSIPHKPLQNRVNIIVSATLLAASEHTPLPTTTIVVSTIKDALEYAARNYPGKKIFGIGGSRVYEELLPLARVIHMTVVLKKYNCDTFFPDIFHSVNIQTASVHVSKIMKSNDIPYIFMQITP